MNASTVSPKTCTFWQSLTLRPYGHQLLSSSGSFWLAIACVLMTAVVIIEGVAWGYFGSSMSAQYGLAAGLLVGFIAMVVTWCIDSTLITYDSDKAYYEEKILGKFTERKAITRKQNPCSSLIAVTVTRCLCRWFNGDYRSLFCSGYF
jgi:hypothetical protein